MRRQLRKQKEDAIRAKLQVRATHTRMPHLAVAAAAYRQPAAANSSKPHGIDYRVCCCQVQLSLFMCAIAAE